MVRRDKGKPVPPLSVPSDLGGPSARTIPSWTFERGQKSKGKVVKTVSSPVLDMVQVPEGSYVRADTAKVYTSPFYMSKFEVSYAKWKQVRDWAVSVGYRFNYDGDMGSMDYQTWKKRPHSPDEPVTGITRDDAIIWCNALVGLPFLSGTDSMVLII